MMYMTEYSASPTLVEMADRKKKLVSIEVDKETLIELKTATAVIGARSYASLIHQQLKARIREAKQMVSQKEWNQIYEEQKIELETKSKQKSLERKKSLKRQKQPADEPEQTVSAKGASAKKPRGKKTLKTSDGRIIPLVDGAVEFADED